MADGGASTIIMLVTALLISSAVSAVLIQEWSTSSRVIQQQQEGLQLSAEIDIDFAGDPMMVSLSTNPGPKDITFYIQNTGIHAMDESSLAILVDGVSIDVDSTAFVPAGGVTWGPNMLLEVTLEVGVNDFTDGQEISIYAIARSEIISGISTSATMNEEVRLNEE